MKTILLIGNPNVGKSAIFSRLTGARVIVSNYPGTTVDFSQGMMKWGGENYTIIDVPGTYTLEPTNKAEEVAVEMLRKGDIIINVVDATNLERNLSLTLELLQKARPMIVALNMWDDTKHKGIDIDVEKLEELLGIPVVPTCGLTGEGVRTLVTRLSEAKIGRMDSGTGEEKWCKIGKLVKEVQKLEHRHHTFLERLQDMSVAPKTGLPIAVVIGLIAFFVIRFIAEGLIGYLIDPFFEEVYMPLISMIESFIGKGILHDILIGRLINGKIEFDQSFGVLTTGLYVPLGMVLPYILSFYLVLGILEDIGYLPRLAVLVDNVMHRLGLHGYAVVPMILGLGCNVPGALATRLLEGKREKFIAATLMGIAVPCMAQIAMIVGLVGERGLKYVLIVFGTLFLIWIVLGMLLHRTLKGQSPELLIEIPPYRIPTIYAVIKKLWMRVRAFLLDAVPFVLFGVLIINLLDVLKVIDLFAKVFTPVLQFLWGLPPESISALIVGFLRKDVAVAMLGPLNLSTKQLVIGSVILAIYFPCIATFMVLVRELGIKGMVKSAGIMLSVVVIVGGLLNLIWRG